MRCLVKNSFAFTFIEILVVIILISLSLGLLIPKLGNFFDIENEKTTKILNKILQEAYNTSVSENRPIMIWGVKGGKLIHYENKVVDLEKVVFRVKVNENYQEGLKYYFFVYPEGLMDKVEMIFEDDSKLESNPLLIKFTYNIS